MRILVLLLTIAAPLSTAAAPVPPEAPLAWSAPPAPAGSSSRTPRAAAADTLHLAECYAAAKTHFPLARRRALAERVARLEIENVRARYRPSLDLEGQGIYHSSVPELPFTAPGIPDVPHDQYHAALNVSQLIYDGGIGAPSRGLAEASARTTAGEVEVAFHDLKERINDAYFTALLQDAALSSLALLKDDLEARRDAQAAQVEQGLVDGGAIDVLDVELLGVEQQIAAARQSRRGALEALEVLTGLDLSDDVTLEPPDVEAPGALDEQAVHPRYRLFDAGRDRLSLQRRIAERKGRPKVGALATGAYGRPAGMDIFETGLSPYYSLGIRVSWSAWDWHTSDREAAMLALQEESVDAQEDAFTQGLRAAAARAWQEVERLRAVIDQDREIERLRRRIAERAANRLDSGVVSATDYLLEQHAEYRATLSRRRHEIELRYAIVRYLTILGRTDEAL